MRLLTTVILQIAVLGTLALQAQPLRWEQASGLAVPLVPASSQALLRASLPSPMMVYLVVESASFTIRARGSGFEESVRLVIVR